MTEIEHKGHSAELARELVSQITYASEMSQPNGESHGGGKDPKDNPDDQKSAEKRYAEICDNIRALDQNSFQLLRFVPLVTTAAILGLSFLNIPFRVLWLISWVGAVVTFGLWRWEMRNIQVCRWLQERADVIERDEFHAPSMMQFALRTKIQREGVPVSFKDTGLNELHKMKILGRKIKFTQRRAETIIYWATILAWLAMPFAVWLSPKK